MALKIKRTNDVGITTNYHKITHMSVNFDGEGAARVRATISHYVDEGYREKSIGANADNSVFGVELDVEQATGNLREAVYNAMKETDEYKGAEDV